MRPIHVVEWEKALIEEAKAKIKRDADQGMQEVALEQALAPMIHIDVERERLRRAKQIIENQKKPGAVDPDTSPQLSFPGFDQYPFEPDRLISDDAGRIIENSKATPSFKRADARRARDHAADAQKWADRKTEESEIFAAWATEEALKGRPALELTWGNCVREAGYLKV